MIRLWLRLKGKEIFNDRIKYVKVMVGGISVLYTHKCGSPV